jgi:2-keto-4-pentenoate hydratase/2-oxohepta-3-ene-1,7-dioic acid hydratase in catechol pathway
MKLARCTDGGQPFWALVNTEQGELRPIEGGVPDWGPAITSGKGESALQFTGAVLPISSVRLLPPIEKTNRVVVAGANYAKHLAADFGIKSHSQPIAFLKAYGALIGANDALRYPPLTQELDHEVELVAVIGDVVNRQNPIASVLGYTVGNDVSSRDLQRSGPPGVGMDLFAAKSGDQTTGLGPWIVTRDEFPFEGKLSLRLLLRVNGDLRQDGDTAEMTWDVAELVKFVDERSSFETGDVMFTGSPAGTAQGSGKFLQVGDVVEAEIPGIGVLRNTITTMQ